MMYFYVSSTQFNMYLFSQFFYCLVTLLAQDTSVYKSLKKTNTWPFE